MHLDRIMSVMEAVAATGRPVATSEVIELTGLPRPTCYRLIHSMCTHRFLDEPETGKYLISEHMVRLGLMGQSDISVTESVLPALKEAADHFGEAVFLSRFRSKGVEIIHVATPRDENRSFIHPGLGFRPLHACSCSKAIAAHADKDFQEKIFESPLKSYTPNTKLDPFTLRSEFASIRKLGFAECVEEIEIGVSSVAAPIRFGKIGASFSIGVTGPVRRFTSERRQLIGSELAKITSRVASAFKVQISSFS